MIAIEIGMYSPATLRQIYGGKAFKRGVEYHLVNALAIYYLKYDHVLCTMEQEHITQKCKALRDSLHKRDVDDYVRIFGDICSYFSQHIEGNHDSEPEGEEAKFLMNYLSQVECLLHLIRSSRQGDLDELILALDEQVKYYFAHDLFHYARLIPVYIAELRKLKEECPETWEDLKRSDSNVKQSSIPFSHLFVDQGLEQQIRALKVTGGITGLTQNEAALDRFLLTAPEVARLVERFLNRYSRSASVPARKEHYQLTGSMADRLARNATTIHTCIISHCDGNPFDEGTDLVNIASMMAIEAHAKDDILNRDQKGQARYVQFVNDRLLTGSPMSIWDPIKKLKLKTHSTWLKKTKIRCGEKVIKLREERQLLARFLIVQQTRPELVPKLEETIGNYEMAVTPRALFATDGSLLLPSDKSSFLKEVEGYKGQCNTSTGHASSDESIDTEADPKFTNPDTLFILKDADEKVMIIDAQAVVQSMTKTPGMHTIRDFGNAFVKRILGLLKGYTEGRVIFDRYIDNSMKESTRSKRQGNITPVRFFIRDEMSIKNISMKLLLSHCETKASLTEYLSEQLLEAFKDRNQGLVVSVGTASRVSKDGLICDELDIHGHEEADTLIPPQVLDVGKTTRVTRDVCVYSPDTDVFLLLIDMAARHRVPGKLLFLTGKKANQRFIDIHDRCRSLGEEKAKALIGLHNFTGADWGGKFAGISKKTWITALLALDSTNRILAVFGQFGLTFNVASDTDNIECIEEFVCKVYSQHTKAVTLPDLRWELFKTKHQESEKLPPTRGTMEPHIQRANFMCMRDKSYTFSKPQLPPLVEHGWESNSHGKLVPIKCKNMPAPASILELIKCGCKHVCKGNCSCMKNGLHCTPLCKCSDCKNVPDYSIVDKDDVDV
ncbi:MAG: TCR domain-containing protein [Sedimenticola sp.]